MRKLKCAYCAWLNSLHVYIPYEKNVILEIHIYSRQQFAHCLDGFTFSRIKLIYNLETCFNNFYDKYNHGPKSYYTSYISVLAAKMHGNIMYTASTKLFPTPLMFKLYFSEITIQSIAAQSPSQFEVDLCIHWSVLTRANGYRIYIYKI